MTEPRPVLEERRERRRAAVRSLERRDARIALGRLVAFAAVVAVGVSAVVLHRLDAFWIVLPSAAFAGLAIAHDRSLRALARARRAVLFHEAALRRLGEDWRGTGDGGDRYAIAEHPYALDLDLFGKGSLFELLCVARTRGGADALARWLLEPAQAPEVRARQRAVAELTPRLDLREDVAVLGEDVRAEVDPERLSAWAEAPRVLPPWLALAAAGLSAVTVLALVGWLAEVIRAVRLRDGARRRVAPAALDPRTDPTGSSAAWSAPARSCSSWRRCSPGWSGSRSRTNVCARCKARSGRAGPGHPGGSARSAGSSSVPAWADNQLFAPFGFMLLWRAQGAVAVERWRAAHGHAVRHWLAAVAELEALSCLAGYAFLFPEDPFPEIEERGALLEAEGLRHPLLARCVPNDLRLGPATQLVVVSGSNMSGKSTLLRTVGANAVLALAGAPVRARRLRISPLQPGATLRIQDSLAEGKSRFWAEITRLRALLDRAAGPVPVLFLLDELLAGTNSRDRRIGAEAVLRALVARGGIGIVTTHDLALSEVATALGTASNVHFEDEVRGGEVTFDFRLRPGVVTHSNAIALMRAVGLDV